MKCSFAADDARIASWEHQDHGTKRPLLHISLRLNPIRHPVLPAESKPIKNFKVPESYSRSGDRFPLNLNIVIHIVGSRGDVQPFLALGRSLKKHGHRVRLATHLAFKDLVQYPDCDVGLDKLLFSVFAEHDWCSFTSDWARTWSPNGKVACWN